MASDIPSVYDLHACLSCGYCISSCPTYGQVGWESRTPRGVIYYLKQLEHRNVFDRILRRGIDLDQQTAEMFRDVIFQCTSCGMCEEVCHVNIEFIEFWEEVKEWAIKNIGPTESQKKMYDRINQFKNPFGEPAETRGDWLPEGITLSDTPEVIFFGGCTESYRMQKLAKASVQIIDKAGVELNILGEKEWCCGSPLLRLGQGEIIKDEFMAHNIKMVEETGAKTVVTACAGCCNTIKNDYPRVLGKLDVEVLHLSEYVKRLMDNGSLEIKNPLNKKVTYHDPCHLGRHAKVYDAPREVIKSLGADFVEMRRSGPESRCCGSGAGVKAAYKDMALNIGVERVEEAIETGAEVIVTTCPFCALNLNEAAKKKGSDLKTVDIVQIALDAL
ncbi:MAG: (Fe-S)-binding protein [Halobacteriota archaeon]|nr:(Fe-S)-binding protein [Halobacteriota archaeon]